ncbi:MAG: hypothetical protein ABI461_08940, partial [Polyangiaceae bacterium]
RKTKHPFMPKQFHLIKAVAHVPIALFATLADAAADRRSTRLRSNVKRVLSDIRRRSASALDALGSLEKKAAIDSKAVLLASVAFAERTLAESVTRARLESFARAVGPLLLRLTEHATRVQLSALHEIAQAQLAASTKSELRKLEVVVGGDHQARARSVGMQYFQKRFGEKPGEEKRVAFAEGMVEPEEALDLVGKRRLDRVIAESFFGDPKRLQQDVLGGAAAKVLRTERLARIR